MSSRIRRYARPVRCDGCGRETILELPTDALYFQCSCYTISYIPTERNAR